MSLRHEQTKYNQGPTPPITGSQKHLKQPDHLKVWSGAAVVLSKIMAAETASIQDGAAGSLSNHRNRGSWELTNYKGRNSSEQTALKLEHIKRTGIAEAQPSK